MFEKIYLSFKKNPKKKKYPRRYGGIEDKTYNYFGGRPVFTWSD